MLLSKGHKIYKDLTTKKIIKAIVEMSTKEPIELLEYLPFYFAEDSKRYLDTKKGIKDIDWYIIFVKNILARAAEIAGIALVDFMDLLKNKNIPWNEYTEDEFRLDRIVLKDFKDELGDSKND